MELSNMGELVISLLWKNSEPRSTNFVIGNTYEVEGKKIKACEELYNELIEYQKNSQHFTIKRTGKIVNLLGKRIK